MKRIIIATLVLFLIIQGKSNFLYSKRLLGDVKKHPLVASVNVRLKIPEITGIYLEKNSFKIFSNLKARKIHLKEVRGEEFLYVRFWIE